MLSPPLSHIVVACAMSGAAAAFYNPYAKKKPFPGISRKPVHGSSPSKELQIPAPETLSKHSIPQSDSRLESKDLPEPLEPLSSRATSAVRSEPLRDAIENSSHATPAISAAIVRNSVNLPLWQRLPSASISFGSAEILTAAEAYQRLRNSSAVGQYDNQSIRFTGVVVHRFVHADASISLVLGDALAALSTRRRPTSILKRSRPGSLGSSGPKTPSVAAVAPIETASRLEALTAGFTVPSASRTAVVAPTTTTGTTRNVTAATTITKRPQSSIGVLNKKKTPVLVYKKQNVGRRVSLAATGLNQTPGRLLKRALLKPLDLMVQAIAGTRNIWIVVAADHPHAPHCTANDLVMVMGEVQSYSTGEMAGRPPGDDDDDVCDDNEDEARCSVLHVAKRLGQRDGRKSVSYLKARIVRNVNGTNMRLHVDALMARRAFLQQQNSSA